MHGKQIKIFDTTLRDGQQCPGAGMSFEHNLEYARLACELRVDILEAGFPSASALDFEIVNTIAREYGTSKYSPIIAGLCQLRYDQIMRTIEALSPAIPFGKARLHTYVPVDPELMEASLGERAHNKVQIIRDTYEFIRAAVAGGCEVQFSPEGYSRVGENFDFTTELIRAAVDAGATTINCPDTIGGAWKANATS
jgi:2-isopropylmalate synthase